ncbi:SUKH-3 domain-containing protein [Nonomuraea sp. NPDC049421]|uniref:SUKH-3 domain-containing protein n=1 Tax=Nonomuraea sp. NPDC049421 TaxID=3155275 RepID=UPI0034237364
MRRFSSEVERMLRRAGWFPGRQVDIEAWKASLALFDWHDEVERFLREFGDISVDVRGPGITTAREPFEFDPELAVGEEDRFAELSRDFRRRFFPVGAVGTGGEFFLAIDEQGYLYLVISWVFYLGDVTSGIERLVTGVKAERVERTVEDVGGD